MKAYMSRVSGTPREPNGFGGDKAEREAYRILADAEGLGRFDARHVRPSLALLASCAVFAEERLALTLTLASALRDWPDGPTEEARCC